MASPVGKLEFSVLQLSIAFNPFILCVKFLQIACLLFKTLIYQSLKISFMLFQPNNGGGIQAHVVMGNSFFQI